MWISRIRIATRVSIAAILFSISLPAASNAQDAAKPGRLIGRIVDAASGAGLSDVGVQLVGTTLGAVSGVDGRYALLNVPAGTATIQVRRIGYRPKTITGLMMPAGGTLEQNVALEEAQLVLASQVVTAEAERGSVSAALDRQRTATGIVNAVTQEQIAKSPDSDAAQAVQRVSGVTVQDGKYVFVRGLGERYTTTSLNGARIPSPEPEKKVVPLDLFPSALLQTVTTSKTFTPDQPGDFSGAQVDIQTREFPLRRVASYSTSTGVNTAATGRTVLAGPNIGREWLAFAGARRDLPAPVREASLTSLSQAGHNEIVRSFRNAWTPRDVTGAPNSSVGIAIGGEDPIFGHRVGYIASGSYSFSQEIRRNERRALAIPTAVAGGTAEDNAFTGSTGRTSVLWGGLLNLSTWLGRSHKIAFNNTYNRTSDNEARRDSGFFAGELNRPVLRQTLRFVERSVRSNQLRGDHVVGERQQIEWSATSSRVTRREPDRSDLLYGREEDPATGERRPLAWTYFHQDGARRMFGDLREQNFSTSGSYRLALGSTMQSHLKVGTLFRSTERTADNRFYNILGRLTQQQAERPAEEIFNGAMAEDADSVFQVVTYPAGGSYAAKDRLGAGFLMFEHAVSARVRVITGARVENAMMTVESEPTVGSPATAELNDTDVLPAAVLNVKLTEMQNLRFSASQTLSRPEYRELSPISYKDVIGDRSVRGNPALRRALIQNYDVRWEWYPAPGEVLSVGVFAKQFANPIEQVETAKAGSTELTYANAEGAEDFGLELEVRKGLGGYVATLAPLTVFANATVMRSEIRVADDTLTGATAANRPMVGQAPYVVNGGLAYASSGGRVNAAVLYNVVGRRITAAATQGLPDAYEQPRHLLDFTLSFPVMRKLSGKFDAKNLLDAPYLVQQGSVTRERYTVGRVFSIGLMWKPGVTNP